MKTHCQICGRLIQAKTGVIAHHGYRRPGQGWQTASCYGAKHRPYEVACDAIPLAIKGVEATMARRKEAMAELVGTPPATFTLERKDAWRGVTHTKVLERPEGFDAERCLGVRWSVDPYEEEFKRRVRGLTLEIEDMKAYLEYLRKRLADWVPQGVLQGA